MINKNARLQAFDQAGKIEIVCYRKVQRSSCFMSEEIYLRAESQHSHHEEK